MTKSKTDEAEHQFKKMTETPVHSLIASLAVPTVISMLITTVYNMTDTYFVSKISIPASGATGIVFSLMAILQAFGFMFGHGSGSCISRHLGAKEFEKAKRYSSTGFFLAAVSGILIMAFGLIFLTPFMKMLGSTSTILPYSKAYALYILIAAPAMTTSCVLNNILRYEGLASLAMMGLTFGGVLNMILDPILIFSLDLGIAGAGIATAVSQYTSMLILLFMFLIGKTQSKVSIKYISLKPRLIWEIISTGAPSLARQGLNSISVMLLNQQAAAYGDECIAAMSIVSKCANLLFSVCVGIGQGFQPVSAFNYGAKKYSRVKSGMNFTWIFGTAVIAVLAAICFAFSPFVISLFRNDTEVIEIGSTALRLICVALLFLPTVMVANMTFQSIGKTGRALFLASSQNGLFFIPLILILPSAIGIMGIELAQPISYIISAIISIPFLLSFSKELKKEIR
ncbi:MAG: MATE family efflux transporter [Eubacterium sp.]|nr:MATE family efflux transporter [Eubacterium sp.]